MCVYIAWRGLTDELSSLKLPQHVQLVCFGPDTLSCIYVWVKARSVSAALVGTHRHLLCLLLCQTHFLYLHTPDAHSGRPPGSLCVGLSGWNVGYVTCPKSLQPRYQEINSCLYQYFFSLVAFILFVYFWGFMWMWAEWKLTPTSSQALQFSSCCHRQGSAGKTETSLNLSFPGTDPWILHNNTVSQHDYDAVAGLCSTP